MKQVKIEVKNCRNCCFAAVLYNDNSISCVCEAPGEIHEGNYRIDSYYKSYKSPRFCPLKKQSLKIEFKK